MLTTVVLIGTSLATLDIGSAILHITSLDFLKLTAQMIPMPEWGR